jgi:hypothetical protein
MATGALAVEFEAAHHLFPNDLAIAKPGQAAHLRRYHDGIVSALSGGREIRNAVPFAPGFDQFPGNVPCDLKSLGNRPPLRYETGKFVRGGKENAFRQFLNLYSNRQFYTTDPTI